MPWRSLEMAMFTVLAQPAAAAFARDDPAPPAATSVTDLDRLTVTAQHREENVQRIALAVSVVDGQALQRRQAIDISRLQALVPSVTFSAGNELRNNAIRIRGVGTDVFSTGVEPSIATVVDGVVMQRPGAAFSDLLDVERVEVLRGPQGTLFGKNASAGVIHVITRAPDVERRSGTVSVLLGQDHEHRVEGALSGPLGDQLAYRVAAVQRSREGDVRNLHDGRLLNDQRAYAVRGKLQWRSPDQRSDVTLSADVARLDADCCALPLIQATTDPRALPTGTAVGRGNVQVNNDVAPFVRQENRGAAVTARVSLGRHTLTSITGWRRFDNDSDVDLDDTQARLVTRNYNVESSRTFTQELRLASPTDTAFDYLLGAYYFDGSVHNALDRRGLNLAATRDIAADGTVVPRVPGDQAVLAGSSDVDSRNAALFGQANWRPQPQLTLTAGLRTLTERQQLRFVRPLDARFNGTDQPPTLPAFGPVNGRYRDSAMIGRLSATYAFTPVISAYLAWGTGYKGEGLAATLGLTAAQFAQLPAPAETSELMEAGFKSTLFNNALMLNLTGFRTRIDDYQAQTYSAASGLFVLTSAGGVAIDGIELEFNARPHAYFSVSGGVTWLDARFDGVPNGPCYTGQGIAQGCRPIGSGSASAQDLDGKPFMNAPRWRSVLGARLDAPLTATVDGYLQLDYRWQDAVVFDISQNPRLTQGAYGIADLSAGAIFRDGRIELGLYVQNLGDRRYAANVMQVSSGGGIDAYAQQLPADLRRHAGLSLRMKF